MRNDIDITITILYMEYICNRSVKWTKYSYAHSHPRTVNKARKHSQILRVLINTSRLIIIIIIDYYKNIYLYILYIIQSKTCM